MLIGGPELVRRQVCTFERCDEAEWMGPSRTSGGAVIDFDRRRVQFFGDELMDEIPHRRALLSVLTEVWTGFQVRWAYGSIPELAGSVDVDVRPVGHDYRAPLIKALDRNWLCQMVSVVGPDGTSRLWPLTPYSSAASWGPALMDALPGRGVKKVALRAFPAGGVHVDVHRKVVGIWRAAETSEVVDELAQAWKRVERRLVGRSIRGTGGSLRVPALDLKAGIGSAMERIRGRLHCRWDGPNAEALALAAALSRAAPGFAVSTEAVFEGVMRPNEREWGGFVDACERLRLIYTKSA